MRVRVVVDGFGAAPTLPRLQRWLAGQGVALAVFRPIDRWWTWLQPGQLRRLHQKLCVVDGEVGFVGGINLIDDRIDLRHGIDDAPRLDFAVALRGPGGRADRADGARDVDPRRLRPRLARGGAPLARSARADGAGAAAAAAPAHHAAR